MKRCGMCGVEKPSSLFFRCTSNRDGLQGRCKACQKAAAAMVDVERRRAVWRKSRNKHYRKNRWGITPDVWQALLEEQGGLCGICRAEPVGSELEVEPAASPWLRKN